MHKHGFCSHQLINCSRTSNAVNDHFCLKPRMGMEKKEREFFSGPKHVSIIYGSIIFLPESLPRITEVEEGNDEGKKHGWFSRSTL